MYLEEFFAFKFSNSKLTRYSGVRVSLCGRQRSLDMIFRMTSKRCQGIMFLYHSMEFYAYAYCYCQSIMGPEVNQFTSQPPWAYCEIFRGKRARITKERGNR